MNRLGRKFRDFIRDEAGAELAEYAVGAALLVAIAVVVYQVLGDALNQRMNETAAEIEGE